MSRLYEGMFVLDNQVVREDWRAAKAIVTATLEKHGANIKSARRWDERRLAYPIRTKQRGTYFLAYYQIGAEEIPTLRRDLDLNEKVMRYLFLRVDDLPEGEVDLAMAEDSADYIVPEPPADDAIDEEPAEEGAEDGEKKPADGEKKPADGEAKPAAGEAKAAEAEAKPAEAKTEDAPAAEESAPEAPASSDGETETKGEAQ